MASAASTPSLEAINRIYSDYTEYHKYLLENQQLSFANDYKSQYSKVMLLSAASYFEIKVMGIVTRFLNTSACPVTAGFLEKKALKRQYHTLFNWDQANANQFFGIFGDEFKEYVKSVIDTDDELNSAIKDFMELGSYRNKLVHENYATFQLPLTAEDVKQKFDNADKFASRIETLVSNFKEHIAQAEAEQ